MITLKALPEYRQPGPPSGLTLALGRNQLADLQKVITDMRPMLEDFLLDVGIQSPHTLFDVSSARIPLSIWIGAQPVSDEQVIYLVSRVAAYICEYLVDAHFAELVIRNKHIEVRVPFYDGIVREFDPYPLAIRVVRHQNSLADVIAMIV